MSRDIINFRNALLQLDAPLRAVDLPPVMDHLQMTLGDFLTLCSVSDIEIKAAHRPPILEKP